MDSLENRARDLVSREVLVCVSSLVSTLASGGTYVDGPPKAHDLQDLCAQAFELASPVLDYEEAARQAGWVWDEPANEFRLNDTGEGFDALSDAPSPNWQDLCEQHDLEPYEWEVFEHWAVSGWLADSLEAVGEKVDKDFAGMCVWARTTTGQAIYIDPCFAKIIELSYKAP
jgi:hypothetical protein